MVMVIGEEHNRDYLNIAVIITFFLNTCTILVMFVKFSTPLAPSKQAAIAVRFISIFNEKDSLMWSSAALEESATTCAEE